MRRRVLIGGLLVLAAGGCSPIDPLRTAWLDRSRPPKPPESLRAVPAPAPPAPEPRCGWPVPGNPAPAGPKDLQIGPVIFRGLAKARPALEYRPSDGFEVDPTRVDLPAGEDAVIALPPGEVDVAIAPWGGRHATTQAVRSVRCTADPAIQTSFRIAFVVAGARCVRLNVITATGLYTDRVRFGVRRCR